MKKILLSLLVFLLALHSFARDFEYTYEGHTLTYTVLDEDAKICGTKDGIRYSFSNIYSGNYVSGALVIPEKVSDGTNEYTVTTIGDYAFSVCKSLTSVTIPGSVTTIGSHAFDDCSGLTKAEFASIESLCKIDFDGFLANPLYYSHHLYINGEEITDLVIPETVTSIGDNAFSGCSGLTDVTIPNSVTTIGSSAFLGCNSLIAVMIPNSVTSLGGGAFIGCNSLKKVAKPSDVSYSFSNEVAVINYDRNSMNDNADGMIFNDDSTELLFVPVSLSGSCAVPDFVTSIGISAFAGCSHLTEIIIPNSVSSIGTFAFSGCSGLTSLVVGESVENIGTDAFKDCELTSLTILTDKLSFWSAFPRLNLQEVTLGDKITKIPASTFSYCTSLKEISISESVVSIGTSAFLGCSRLASVTIGNSVTSIGNSAFSGCSGLTELTIGNSVATIGEYAFNKCSGLTEVTIPNSVTSIGYAAFRDCSGLSSVAIGNSVSNISYYAFNGCSSLTSLSIPNQVESVGAFAFSNCSGLKSVILGTGITSFDKTVFTGTPIVKAAIPSALANPFGESVITISFDAFDSLIGDDGCLYTRDGGAICFAHTDITNAYEIPSTVHTIKENAFALCSKLTRVQLPANISEIEVNAWAQCGDIAHVECLSEDPCTAPNNIFMPDVYDNATLHVPAGMVDKYRDIDPWSLFYDITDDPMPAAIEDLFVDGTLDRKQIDYSASYDVYNLQGISVGDSVNELTPGFYIVRQGSKVAKILK